MPIDKLARRKHVYAPPSGDPQEIAVSGHDEWRLRRRGDGEELVIVGIVADGHGQRSCVDDDCVHGDEREDGLKSRTDRWALPPELVPDPPILLKNLWRKDEGELPCGPRRRMRPGTPPKNTPETTTFCRG